MPKWPRRKVLQKAVTQEVKLFSVLLKFVQLHSHEHAAGEHIEA